MPRGAGVPKGYLEGLGRGGGVRWEGLRSSGGALRRWGAQGGWGCPEGLGAWGVPQGSPAAWRPFSDTSGSWSPLGCVNLWF